MALDETLRQAKGISLTPFNGKDSVSSSDRNDLRRFRLSNRSSVEVRLSGLKGGANADLELFTLKNGALKRIGRLDFSSLTNRQRRQNLTVVGSAKTGGNANEALNATLDAGEYYLRVQYRRGQGRINYRLAATASIITVTNPTDPRPIDPNNPGVTDPVSDPIFNPGDGDTFETATPLTVDFNRRSLNNAVGDRDVNDYYSFNLAEDSVFDLGLVGLTANADIELISAQTGDTIAFSRNAGTQAEAIRFGETLNGTPLPLLSAGDYYIRVYQPASGQNAQYRMEYSAVPLDRAGNTPAEARDLTTDLQASNISIDTPYQFQREFVGGADNYDYFKFDVPTGGKFVSATVMPALGDVSVVLFQDNGAGGLGKEVVRSVKPGTIEEAFGGNLAAGTYYLQIESSPSNQGSTYDLSMYTRPAKDEPTISRDISPGERGSDPTELAVVGSNRLFFVASDGTDNTLWQADGREGDLGTLQSVKKLALGVNLRNIRNLVGGRFSGNDVLYFTANTDQGNGLWRTDGTAQGTQLVFNTSSVQGVASFAPDQFVNVNGTLYFVVDIAGSGSEASRLYRSNGTAAGTAVVPQAQSGPFTGEIRRLTNINNVLYFSARTATTGTEAWRITAPNAAPQVINVAADSAQEANSSAPRNFFSFNNKVYFVAAGSLEQGNELWQFDPTTSQASLAVDLFTGFGQSGFDDTPNFAVFNDELYFTATGNQVSGVRGKELWKLSTSGTVQLVADLNQTDVGETSSNPGELTVINNGVQESLYFTANNGVNGRELWRLDSNATTPQLLDLQPGSVASNPDQLTAVNETLYFRAAGTTPGSIGKGTELWKIAADGTQTTFDILPGIESSAPSQLTTILGRLFFVANNGNNTIRGNGTELWVIG